MPRSGFLNEVSGRRRNLGCLQMTCTRGTQVTTYCALPGYRWDATCPAQVPVSRSLHPHTVYPPQPKTISRNTAVRLAHRQELAVGADVRSRHGTARLPRGKPKRVHDVWPLARKCLAHGPQVIGPWPGNLDTTHTHTHHTHSS